MPRRSRWLRRPTARIYAVRRMVTRPLARHALRMRLRGLSIVGPLLAVILTACGGQSPSSAAATAAGSASTGASAAASVASPSASVTQGAAPPEIAGTWRRVVQGEEVLLTLDGTGYNIQRAGELGSGGVFVEGDEIRFLASSRCAETGLYRWTIEEGRLRLSEIEFDPCTGRTDVLLRGTFGPVEP